MEYTLVSKEIKVATEHIRCDGSASWDDWVKEKKSRGENIEYDHVEDPLKLMMSKKGISPGREYIERIFVDSEGQKYFLNSTLAADRVCIKNKIYHPEILNQIK